MKKIFVLATAMMFVALSFAQTVIPGRVEAETYIASRGVSKNTTNDVGGGQHVTGLQKDDWVSYRVRAWYDGSYVVSFRVYSLSPGAEIHLKDSTGQVLRALRVNVTGWTTVADTVTLHAGVQTLQVYATQTPAWSLNWMEFHFLAQLYFRSMTVIPNSDSVLQSRVWMNGRTESIVVHKTHPILTENYRDSAYYTPSGPGPIIPPPVKVVRRKGYWTENGTRVEYTLFTDFTYKWGWD